MSNMTTFIKFSNAILNATHIHKIIIRPNKYYIYVGPAIVNGFNMNAGAIGFGNISTTTSEFEVCKTKHPADYKILEDWIHKNS